MPSSGSEDFESADEGTHFGTPVQHKKEKKKRLSSSNYSDCTQESDQERKKSLTSDKIEKTVTPIVEKSDGWGDFDVDTETLDTATNTQNKVITSTENQSVITKKVEEPSTGWDDFDDWGQDVASNDLKQVVPKPTNTLDNIRDVADRLSAVSVNEQKPAPGGSSWGWGGWGMESILTSATAGITTLTSQVSQGITTVLESSIGAPDPEDLAKRNVSENSTISQPEQSDSKVVENVEEKPSPSEASFPFGNILSGVTKFVETTGTKVIAGGLDTLETIGKKTMEVLQDGDPGLAKKRAMLGLNAGDKPVLSQLLREAKTRADEEDRIKEQKREAKEVHYETLFDDFEGLVHLEALEMLSKQISMRIEERLRSVDAEKRHEIKETLQQVAELCEMPLEDNDHEEMDDSTDLADAFHQRLLQATEDLGLKLQFQPLVKQYREVLTWLRDTGEELTEKAVYKKSVSCLAQCTALAVEVYHKTAEMLLVKTRRSTADEADSLTQMTVVLTRHVGDLATRFTDKLNSMASGNQEQTSTYITNVFLEGGNSSSYIQNAFQLTLPILQIGAA